jgi:hypothetical protein
MPRGGRRIQYFRLLNAFSGQIASIHRPKKDSISSSFLSPNIKKILDI